MTALNKPTGWDEDRREEDEWSPTIGLRRAAIHGLIAASVMVLVLLPIAKYAPLMLLVFYLRAALGFLVAWILMGVVQRAAGMVGWACTALGVGLSALVLVSTQIAAASFAPASGGASGSGIAEVSASALVLGNVPALVGVGFAAALCHRGGAGWDLIVDVLMRNPLWFYRR